jgi:integrase
MVRKYLRATGHFAHWLECEGIPPSSLSQNSLRIFTDEHLARCCCAVPAGESLSHTRAAVGHLLGLLRRRGEIPHQQASQPKPVEVVLETFEAYLLGICGATPGTSRLYSGQVRSFLQTRYGEGLIDLTQLVPSDVVFYVSEYATRVERTTAKTATNALRSFLRCLRLQGLCDVRLLAAVPTVRVWKLSDIPKLWSDDQLRLLLASFDRSTGLGRRDYAMALCLVRLGMRVGEVSRLRLDDIDWRSATVRIAGGKGRRCHVLPLPDELGRALVAYLKRGRPRSPHRRLFLRHTAPVGEPIGAGAVGRAMWRAHGRSHVGTRWKGAHALRHTAATGLLRAGASLKEIADILGHRSIDSTTIYAKVDLERLAGVALPWPEVHS